MALRKRHNDVDSADAVVIGAGAAGAVASMRLAEAGCKVVCLEQGAWVSSSDFPSDRLEWELLARKQWHPNPNVRRAPSDYPCETSESDMSPLMFNAVGGSTVLYAAQWPRFLPSDFRVRSLEGIADDWPLTYNDLVPYYERLEAQIGVSGLRGDPAYPPGAAPPLPPLPIGEIGRKAAEGLNKLGWHWWPGPNAIASRPYRNLGQCTLRGTCMTGCPEGAKASTDVTLWPEALRYGARLITGARVREIPVSRSGRALGAIYIDRNGNEHLQRGSVVIVAANGVGTPRLLLLSTSKRFPGGLANSAGLVGRRLMTHPYAAVIGVYEDDIKSWVGPHGQTIQSLEFYETREDRGFVRGAKWAAMPTGGPLTLTMLEKQRWGDDHHRMMKELIGHCFEWGIMAEDLPNDANRVILDPDLKDADGIPAPKIIYRTSQNTHALLDFHLARVTDAHLASGAKRTIVVPLTPNHGYHLMGTARMGTDPRTSVVDAYGRTHDVPNLYIYDGSVFVTSGSVNPAATITSVALRCVDHLLATAPLQEVPV